MKQPELLAPAGTLKHLHTAIAYGADAVYAGLPRYSLRVRNNDFDHLEQLANGIAAAHAAGRKLYLAANVLPHNSKVKSFLKDLEPVVAHAPDALIVADPGLLLLARERWPDLPLHLSVQANTMNHAAVRFWAANGVSRIILSRELALDEIAEIRQLCPETELEVFVHGALCIAFSGRCLLSGYFNHRDANQGACTNACRWQYQVIPATPDSSGDLLPSQSWLLEQRERPGELMPMEEDEHGTYILNSRDLRAVQHVARLAEMGIDSLKIEGRTKTPYYVARTTAVYRRAIDDYAAGRPFDPHLTTALEGLANRGYTEGFYNRHAEAELQNYRVPHSESELRQYVAEITQFDPASGLAELEVKNRFAIGDTLELIAPGGGGDLLLERMEALDGRPLSVAPGSGWRVRIPLPPGDYRHAFLARHLTTNTGDH